MLIKKESAYINLANVCSQYKYGRHDNIVYLLKKIIYFIVSFLFLSFFWFYISIFGAI